MYRTILVHLDEDEGLDARLAAARHLAGRFHARVVGVHVAPLPVLPVGYGEVAAHVGPEFIEAQREAARERGARLEARLRGVLDGTPAAEVVFLLLEGEPRFVLPECARAADIALASQSGLSGLGAIEPDVAEHLATDSGGPVLVLPRGGWSGEIGRRVLVGWNGSKQAARALADALPFLRAAERVWLVALGEDLTAAGLEEVAARLRAQGIEPVAERHEPQGPAGAQLLDLAHRHGMDLLVMGAYSHSRLRELVLGGATRHVLGHADLPVLLSG